MSSPFPGMDPYLEGEMWQEFHGRLANQISSQLMPLLKPKYVALLHKRYVFASPSSIMQTAKSVYPDVSVIEHRTLREAAAVAEPETGIVEPVIELPNPEPVPQLSVEIRDVAERRLVTLIEILSPANKYGDGANEYRRKRQEVLSTSAHLLELDLLRGGQRITLIGEPPTADYYAYLSRYERRPNTAIWPIVLTSPLPTLPVPLLQPDPDIPLALQQAVDACFELVGYENLLNYTDAPPPPDLNKENLIWIHKVLTKAGFRS